MPDLALHGGRRVAELMHEARPALLDLGVAWAGSDGLEAAAEHWFGRTSAVQPA